MSDLFSRQALCEYALNQKDKSVTPNDIMRFPSAQPKPSDITDEQAILHLQSTGWMQNHDREMYESGLKKRLADDSGDYDSLIPCEDTVSRQQAITDLRALSDADGYINAPHEVVTDVVRGLPPVKVKQGQTTQPERGETDKLGVKTGETYKDTISRQAAIDTAEFECGEWIGLARTIVKAIKQLPSAPERKRGEWIEQDDGWDGIYYECSVCREPFTLIDGTPSDNLYNFCPNCGADMREGQDG